MADGEQPRTKWDGRVFEDVLRLGLAAAFLLFKACLVAIKGDWKEIAETFGFSTWATKAAPCYACWCTKANYLLDASFSAANQLWPDFTMDDYEAACASSEVTVVVKTLEMLRRIRSCLFFDWRDSGAHGRELRCPVPARASRQGIVWNQPQCLQIRH